MYITYCTCMCYDHHIIQRHSNVYEQAKPGFHTGFFVGGGGVCGNQGRLMRISIVGPALPAVNFSEVLNLFKPKNRRIQL